MYGMGQGVIRRAWSWLWRPVQPPAGGARHRTPNGECPLCARPVVVAGTTHLGNIYTGPMMAPPTRQELINACAIHGRPPFNDATVNAAEAGPSS
jgi:hypothetical protein